MLDINEVKNKESINKEPDIGDSLYFLIGALFPIIGLILGLYWTQKKPISSKQLFTGCIIFASISLAIILMIIVKNFHKGIIIIILDAIFIKYMISKTNKNRDLCLEDYTKTYNIDIVTLKTKIKDSDKNLKNLIFAILLLVLSGIIFILPLVLDLLAKALGLIIFLFTLIFFLPLYIKKEDNIFLKLIEDLFNYEGSPLTFIPFAILSLIGSIILFVKYFKNRKNIKNFNTIINSKLHE